MNGEYYINVRLFGWLTPIIKLETNVIMNTYFPSTFQTERLFVHLQIGDGI